MSTHTHGPMKRKQGACIPKKLIRQGSMGESLRALLCLLFTLALTGMGFLPPLHLGPGRTILQTSIQNSPNHTLRAATLGFGKRHKTRLGHNILYATNAVGASNDGQDCDVGTEVWKNTNRPNLTCQVGAVSIVNAHKAPAGTFLTELPHSMTYPNDYIVEAQMQQDPSSHADFGLTFRTQPGDQPDQQLGGYSFLIHPDGTWSSYVYDLATGDPTEIASGAKLGDAHGTIALDVLANGPDYTFYINRSPNPIGHAHDDTYTQGNAGIVLNSKGKLTVQNFAFYTKVTR